MKTQAIITKYGKARINLRETSASWYFRGTIAGIRRDAPLATTSQTEAQQRAKALLSGCLSNPWDDVYPVIVGKEDRDNCTIDQYIKLYGEYVEESEHAPDPKTWNQYTKSLKLVSNKLNIETVNDLKSVNVSRLREFYPNKTTLNSMIRFCKALFKDDILKWLRVRGYTITNPFVNISSAKIVIEPYSPLAKDKITELEKELANSTNNHKLMYILCNKLGFRKNEADKARFDWIAILDSGAVITIQKTDNFQPKSRQSRQIIIGQTLLEEIIALRGDSESPYLIPSKINDNRTYRLRMQWDQFAAILAKYDMTVHDLRKMAGSVFATKHGLFATKTLLGHYSQALTEKYYSSLVNLPVID